MYVWGLIVYTDSKLGNKTLLQLAAARPYHWQLRQGINPVC